MSNEPIIHVCGYKNDTYEDVLSELQDQNDFLKELIINDWPHAIDCKSNGWAAAEDKCNCSKRSALLYLKELGE